MDHWSPFKDKLSTPRREITNFLFSYALAGWRVWRKFLHVAHSIWAGEKLILVLHMGVLGPVFKKEIADLQAGAKEHGIIPFLDPVLWPCPWSTFVSSYRKEHQVLWFGGAASFDLSVSSLGCLLISCISYSFSHSFADSNLSWIIAYGSATPRTA